MLFMRELIEGLERADKVSYLLDTCFLIHEFTRGRVKELEEFCLNESVGMSSFNLLELDHVVHKLPGPLSRHLRGFLKKKLVKLVYVSVVPGDRSGEKEFVDSFDPKILSIVSDPSDAVMFVQALKIRADILTRDRHHVFNCAAENFSDLYGVKVMNKYP